MEAVTAVLVDRAQESRGLSRMLAGSLGLHALVVVAVVLGPGRWITGTASNVPKVVMNVSLGGAGRGPDVGGANPLGGRPVQQVATPALQARPEPIRPPAAKTPAMTLPAPAAAKKPRGKPEKAEPAKPAPAPLEVKSAPEGATGRTPITGPEEKFGSSFAETGVSGLGLGLATGGGGTGSSLDVGDFCCPDYLRIMTRRITENWDSRQAASGITVMRFTILRDGRITDIGVEQSAGYVLDLTAQRSLQRVGRLPALPPAYTFPNLTVYLRFEYQR
jgi:outer membrane biosynthesis protein TonB